MPRRKQRRAAVPAQHVLGQGGHPARYRPAALPGPDHQHPGGAALHARNHVHPAERRPAQRAQRRHCHHRSVAQCNCIIVMQMSFSASTNESLQAPCSTSADGVPRVPVDTNEARRLTLQEADAARRSGIKVFAIGIGPEVTPRVLNGIADQPPSQHTFQVDQFEQLENILSSVTRAACTAPPPSEYSAPPPSECTGPHPMSTPYPRPVSTPYPRPVCTLRLQ